ncbi:MAG TPA: hypothetical protein VGV67_06535 [Solirubrobacteraceae bacterium]|nr:hypothetical protein [Solirubrobacteraceae bacterium]
MAATPDETLAEERQRRTKAGATAIAAGVLTFIGALAVLAAVRDFPVVHLLDALRSSLGQQQVQGPGPVARALWYFDDHVAGFAAFQLVPAVAAAAVGVAMTYLYRSTAARNPQVGKLPLISAVSGSVMLVVAALVTTVSLTLDVQSFADAANQSEEAARDVFASPVRDVGGLLSTLGRLALTVAIVIGALNAMRVGLLTRFMGVLGMIVGALFLIPQLEGSVPFVRIFWLIALGMLFLHRWPGSMPPAWVTGEAHPWPTQQELREQRDAARAERGAAGTEEKVRRPRRGRAEPPETPAPEPPRAAKPHPSSKKKKRKRR